jgi:AraC-like DNA-binding protein
MPCSISNCTDVDEFRSNIRQANNEIIVTSTGSFSARVIKIDLHRLWMQQLTETLPRSWYVQMKDPRRLAIGFPAAAGSPMKRQGIDLMPEDIALFSPAEPGWHTTSGPSQFATMSLPEDDLVELGIVLTGQTIMPATLVSTAKVAPALLKRLQSLHRAAAYLVEHSPEILADPNTARGLEAPLTEAMIACLASGRMRTETASQRRGSLIIKRLRELEEANRDRTLYLTEVCKAIRVSQRTLTDICQDVLGVSPKRYLYLRRLHLVHRELRDTVPGRGQVTQIATKYGFWELGRFSVAYREVFGQSPSASLRQT